LFGEIFVFVNKVGWGLVWWQLGWMFLVYGGSIARD
jgi:hypothetical protein